LRGIHGANGGARVRADGDGEPWGHHNQVVPPGMETPTPQSLALSRLGFLMQCLLELLLSLRQGDVAGKLLAFAWRHGAVRIVASQAVDPRVDWLRARLADLLPVVVLEAEPCTPLVDLYPDGAHLDLRHSSRHWKRAEALVWAAA